VSILIWTWSCILAPTIAAIAVRLFKKPAYYINIIGMLISLCSAVMLLVLLKTDLVNIYLYTWLSAGVDFDFGFWLDSLSIYMTLIVTTISLAVHIYSIGYMKGDPHINRYFSYVSLFTTAMLLLVLSDNLLMLFFGWEGVGVCSYLLIGYWYQKAYPEAASYKAFLVNRIADVAMVIGMALLVYYVGSLNYTILLKRLDLIDGMLFGLPIREWVCLSVLLASMGKSAQMPLHIWLPDSMAGPTPISALIHAATMVTAGVYLICRLSFLFVDASFTNTIMLLIGSSQMFLMGMLALSAFDIKRIVAFSTLSQLGMMMMCVAVSGYTTAIFHLGTHAFFKSLLFLVSGAVIVLSDHEQDIRYTSSIRQQPMIKYGLLIGCLALSGVPPLSGFFSKDLVIYSLNQSNIAGISYAKVMMFLSVIVSAAYSARLYFVVASPRKNQPNITSVDMTMSGILVMLIAGSVASGWLLLAYLGWLSVPLADQGYLFSAFSLLKEAPSHFGIYGIFIGWISVYMAYVIYPGIPYQLTQKLPIFYKVLKYEYGFNAVADYIVVPSYQGLSNYFATQVDQKWIDRYSVMVLPKLTQYLGKVFRQLHQGKIYEYAAWMGLLVIALVIIY
jgi:NADH-quinone oxidoreductase subunit L